MLSDEARAHWQAFAELMTAEGGHVLHRDQLNAFLISIHLWGEELSAHELKELLEALPLEADQRRELGSFVEGGLALLVAYDRATQLDDGPDDFEVGPGDLVL